MAKEKPITELTRASLSRAMSEMKDERQAYLAERHEDRARIKALEDRAEALAESINGQSERFDKMGIYLKGKFESLEGKDEI